MPEVEVVRRGVEAHVVGRTIERAAVHHPRAVRRHLPGALDLTARLAGRRVVAARRRGKYLWLDLAGPEDAPDAATEALVVHLGMSGQLLVQPAAAPQEKHLRVALDFTDGDPQLRFVDQRTFGGMALEPLVPAVDGPAPDGRAADGWASGAGGDTARDTVPATVAHIAR